MNVSTGLTRARRSKAALPWAPSRHQRSSLTHTKLQNFDKHNSSYESDGWPKPVRGGRQPLKEGQAEFATNRSARPQNPTLTRPFPITPWTTYGRMYGMDSRNPTLCTFVRPYPGCSAN